MRKNLFPLLASLAFCAAVTGGVVVSTARAENSQPKPRLVALVSPPTPMTLESAGPPIEGGPAHMPPHAMAPERRAAMCRDIYAHEVGALAYLEARLDLTAAQQSAFQRWKQVRLDIAKRRVNECGAHPAPARAMGPPSPIEDMAREESHLKTRLADISAESPALEAFYNTLSPAQKGELHPGGGRMDHHMLGDMGSGRRMGPPPPAASPPQ